MQKMKKKNSKLGETGEGARERGPLLKLHRLLFDHVLHLCCVNLGEQNPIYRAASLFHSCLATRTHVHARTQREYK